MFGLILSWIINVLFILLTVTVFGFIIITNIQETRKYKKK
jgi:hypothetical protein